MADRCKSCRFFEPYEPDGSAAGRDPRGMCRGMPPQWKGAECWGYPRVYPEERACSLFQLTTRQVTEARVGTEKESA